MSYYRSRAGRIEEGRQNGISSDSDVEYQRHQQSLEEEYQKALANEGEKAEYGRRNRSEHDYQQHQQQNQPQQQRLSSLSSRLAATNANNTLRKRHKQKLVTSFVIGEKRYQSKDDSHENNAMADRNLDARHSISTDVDISSANMMDVECDQRSTYNPHPEMSLQSQDHYISDATQRTKEHSNTDFMEEQPERMEIDDLFLTKLPLVVIDGANVAYAYAQALGMNPNTSLGSKSIGRTEPEVLGIEIAVKYFLDAGCRVQVVIPLYWMRRKPNDDNNNGNGTIKQKHQIQVLQSLQSQGMLCCSPPTDDDDAYCISIARRIDSRFRNTRKQEPARVSLSHLNSNDLTLMGGAYILSNDLFRDAIARDSSDDLRTWLEGNMSIHKGKIQYSDVDGLPRRISYSFCDLGSFDQYGDMRLDFVPNPRHPLIGMVERSNRSGYNNP